MLRTIALFTVFLISSCAINTTENIAILNYQDFGPQVIASEILGTEWWQWQAHGESRPRAYDIKVVVYRAISLEDVKQQYPVKPELKQDYRYVEYQAAMTYLDDRIGENVIEDITEKLEITKAKIFNKIGK
ncbi:hypothetical protein QWY82_10220 [Simiduia curdlanivorans]|uniref:Lipoprotein n=1 Tax=Simiduia curdlanivorans TaxID=1492769 RepID=A0ABV8V1P8_9GAMM|nr:hypothetical protein [Simiduia curdlanivorans]MDN3639185.1 hypothetical protein [Simiduia curdlanivorans]